MCASAARFSANAVEPRSGRASDKIQTLKAPMAFLVFALSLVLLAAGLAGAYMSLDLIPTSIGVLYALSGAIAVSSAVLTFALGVAIRRIDALATIVRRLEAPPAAASPQGGVGHVEPTSPAISRKPRRSAARMSMPMTMPTQSLDRPRSRRKPKRRSMEIAPVTCRHSARPTPSPRRRRPFSAAIPRPGPTT